MRGESSLGRCISRQTPGGVARHRFARNRVRVRGNVPDETKG